MPIGSLIDFFSGERQRSATLRTAREQMAHDDKWRTKTYLRDAAIDRRETQHRAAREKIADRRYDQQYRDSRGDIAVDRAFRKAAATGGHSAATVKRLYATANELGIHPLVLLGGGVPSVSSGASTGAGTLPVTASRQVHSSTGGRGPGVGGVSAPRGGLSALAKLFNQPSKLEEAQTRWYNAQASKWEADALATHGSANHNIVIREPSRPYEENYRQELFRSDEENFGDELSQVLAVPALIREAGRRLSRELFGSPIEARRRRRMNPISQHYRAEMLNWRYNSPGSRAPRRGTRHRTPSRRRYPEFDVFQRWRSGRSRR